jgi:hypothetical protein
MTVRPIVRAAIVRAAIVRAAMFDDNVHCEAGSIVCGDVHAPSKAHEPLQVELTASRFSGSECEPRLRCIVSYWFDDCLVSRDLISG